MHKRQEVAPLDVYPTRLHRSALLQQWGNVPIMAATSAVNVGSLMLWSPILPLILRDLGASDLQVSAGVAAWTAAGALGQYAGGLWTDRFGRFPIAVYPLYVASAALAMAARVSSWMSFVAAYVMYSAVAGLQHPVFPAVIGESVSDRLRGRAFGTVHLFIAAATVIGPLIGAQLVPRFGGQNLMLITACVWIVSGGARHRFLSEDSTRRLLFRVRPQGPAPESDHDLRCLSGHPEPDNVGSISRTAR
ncbi:MAG: MFS transporter [Bacillota bacterium]